VPRLHADLRDGHHQRQGGRRQQGQREQVAARQVAPVQDHREAAGQQEHQQKQRQAEEGGRRPRQRMQVELDAGHHEEDRDEEAEAERFELVPHRLASLSFAGQPDDDARRQRPQHDVEAEVLRQHDERPQQHHRHPHGELRAGVQFPLQQAEEVTRSGPCGEDGGADRDGREREQHEGRGQAVAAVCAFRGQDGGDEHDRAELAEGPRRDDEAPERRAGLAGVAQDRDQGPQGGGRQGHGQEQARLDDAGHLQQPAEGEADAEGEEPAEARGREGPSADRLEVDLQPRQKEQEQHPEAAEHDDDRPRLRPAEDLGADQDAEHDLQHDHRHAQAREQVGQERRQDGDEKNDQQGVLFGRRHGRPSAMTLRRV
jgi:hypothetical protein